jgi:hypothetical protein
MLRQRGLAQAHCIDEFADFHLAAGEQETEDQQTTFIAEQLQHARRGRGLLGQRRKSGAI